jgi:hypothetical protein
VGMKRFSLIVVLIGAVVSWGQAAFATMPLTACPTTFTCAFDAAEVRPLSDATPGAPGVFVGYLSFDGTGHPTLDSLGILNGNVQTLVTSVGTCTAGDSTKLGVLDFTGNSGPKFEFVSDNSGAELRVMIVEDSGSVTPSAVNLGTCTQQ